MQTRLEFSDSEVQRVHVPAEAPADTLCITFSAAYVRRAPASGGYAQSLEILCQGARWEGPLADGIGRLSGGRLLDGATVQSSLGLPYTSTGPVRLELQFSNGTQLHIHTASLRCRFTGDPKFVESLAC